MKQLAQRALLGLTSLLEAPARVGERRFWPSRNAEMEKQADGTWRRVASNTPQKATGSPQAVDGPKEGAPPSCPEGRVRDVSSGRCLKPMEFKRQVDDLVRSAKTQKSWKSWYRRNQDVMSSVFGQDAQLMTKILGATSQAASVHTNISLAFRAYGQMLRNEPFEGFMEGVKRNLNRVREGGWPTGPKIGPYTKALAGHTEAVAVDRHIAQLLYDKISPTDRQVREGKKILKEVAKELGWEPREVQAALWAFNQVRKGKDPGEVESYDTIFERDADNIKAMLEELRGSIKEDVAALSDLEYFQMNLLRALGPDLFEATGDGLKEEIAKVLMEREKAFRLGAKLAKALAKAKKKLKGKR